MKPQACTECGTRFSPKRDHSAFCGRACRNKWNNRRLQRGAVLYDLLMAMRYDRDAAAALGIDQRFMQRLAMHWHNNDKQAGRARTWRNPADVAAEYRCTVEAITGQI